MKKNKIISYVLVFSILTFVSVFIFIVQKSYDSLMKPINEVKQSIIIKPIDPNLDIATLDAIEARRAVEITPTIFP